MKIFNWVQKRFHQNVLKDGLARNVKKTESIAIDTNTKALLEQVALVDVLDGWRDGILTIGTFGFDPLSKPSDKEKENFFMESEEEEEKEEEDDDEEDEYSVNIDEEDDDNNNAEKEEVNPLMFSAFERSFDDMGLNAADYYYDDDVDEGANFGKPADRVIMTVDGVPLTSTVGSTHEIKFDFDMAETQQGKLRRRTTLADLFSEDSDLKKNPKPDELLSKKSAKKSSARPKHSLSFAKKLIPQVGEDSRPIKKLHKMMRRMLKRKIHPEIEGKASKAESVNIVLASKKQVAGESISLL